MHWQADADNVFRCPTAGCRRYWESTRPLPEQRFPMLHTANGMPKCPGCALVFRSYASLYSHYSHQRRRGDMRHPGRVCAATPKNLLSSDQQEELRHHWQSCKQVAERTKRRHPHAEQSKARHRVSVGWADPSAVFDEEYVFVDIDNIPNLSTDDQVGTLHQDSRPNNNTVGVFQHDQQGTQYDVTDAHTLATVGTDSTALKNTPTDGTASTEPNNLLPVSCQCSVLVQGYLAGLVALNVLQQSSSQPPQIHHPLLGTDGFHLLSRIKRQVALKFHSDKSVGVESDAYKQFNSRVDELSKANGDYIGWTRYNQMLDVELAAARQYLQHVQS